jgi:Fe-S cluster assembly iron-binding protein IscA
MTIEITPEAVAVLRRSLELSGVDPASGGVRLRATRALGGGVSVQIELAEGSLPGEETIEADGVKVFVDPSVWQNVPDPIVTVEPQHERVVVRTKGEDL